MFVELKSEGDHDLFLFPSSPVVTLILPEKQLKLAHLPTDFRFVVLVSAPAFGTAKWRHKEMLIRRVARESNSPL
jgi:hypothetical protein